MSTTTPDTVTIIQRLDADRAALVAAAKTVPGHYCTERLDANRWSVAEVLEHVSNIDIGVTRMIAMYAAQPLTATPAQLDAARMTDERVGWVRNREKAVEAPERVRP